jgi:hypothetical protein
MAVGGGVAKSDGRRSVFCAGDRGGAVGQGRNARALSGEHVAAMHPKGAHRAVTPVSELREDLFQTAVGPGDRAATWDRPRDVWVQQRPQKGVAPCAVELVLRCVQAREDRGRFSSIDAPPVSHKDSANHRSVRPARPLTS